MSPAPGQPAPAAPPDTTTVLSIIPADGWLTARPLPDRPEDKAFRTSVTRVVAFALVECEGARVVRPVGPDGEVIDGPDDFWLEHIDALSERDRDELADDDGVSFVRTERS